MIPGGSANGCPSPSGSGGSPAAAAPSAPRGANSGSDAAPPIGSSSGSAPGGGSVEAGDALPLPAPISRCRLSGPAGEGAPAPGSAPPLAPALPAAGAAGAAGPSMRMTWARASELS
jgi:hypothetical protein